MQIIITKLTPFCILLLSLFLVEAGVSVQYADARSRFGGRMFSRPMPQKAPVKQSVPVTKQTGQQGKSGFGKGLAGGLLGGALGAFLFGSLFGAAGQGMGILPILLLAGVGYFLFRRMTARASASGYPAGGGGAGMYSATAETPQSDEEGQDFRYLTPVEQALEEIGKTDPHFDKNHFVEVASDVFFQVQAGWMRRDLNSYKHLLGKQLAEEYAAQFAEMEAAGHLNKLESIAIRKVEMVNGGSDGSEDFVTVLFTASLLDYTIDETSGEVVDGSMTTPVKFAEEWTWARQSGSENWLLEGIKVVSG